MFTSTSSVDMNPPSPYFSILFMIKRHFMLFSVENKKTETGAQQRTAADDKLKSLQLVVPPQFLVQLRRCRPVRRGDFRRTGSALQTSSIAPQPSRNWFQNLLALACRLPLFVCSDQRACISGFSLKHAPSVLTFEFLPKRKEQRCV